MKSPHHPAPLLMLPLLMLPLLMLVGACETPPPKGVNGPPPKPNLAPVPTEGDHTVADALLRTPQGVEGSAGGAPDGAKPSGEGSVSGSQ
jgi:hypothetical protein